MKLNKLLGSVALATFAASASGQTVFNLSFIAGTSVEEQAAFTAAASRWSSLLSDNVTIDLTVGTGFLSGGVLAQAGSARTDVSYSTFYSALNNNRTSSFDNTAVNSLSTGPSFGMLINRTSDNPNGFGSPAPYVDNDGGANNSTVRLTNANAKALGIAPTLATVSGCLGTCDAFIKFGTGFSWDLNPNDGITAGNYDFVGIATHEIGHALGFVSGVDVLDNNSPPYNGPFSADDFTFVSSLDLFRYSASSTASGVIDWTADTRTKYFSIDGGSTVGPSFSTGVNFGDGRQASHWKDGLGIGIMDPTAAKGELLGISANDLLAFDVIGWDRVVAVPEPETYAMLLAGLGLLGFAARRRKLKEVATA